MENPANELAALIERWNEPNPGSTIEEDRGVIALEAGFDLWAHQALAMSLLAKCQEEIEVLRRSGVNVSHYGDATESWTKAIAMPGAAWNSSNSGKTRCISPSDLNLLRGLASQIDQLRGIASPYEIQRQAVESFLEQAESLAETAGFPEGPRAFIRNVIVGIREALEADDPQRVLEYFSMLLGAIAMAADTDEAAPWADKARKFRHDLSVALVKEQIVRAVNHLARGIHNYVADGGEISGT